MGHRHPQLNQLIPYHAKRLKTENTDWNNLMLIPKEPFTLKFKEESFFERKIQNVYEEGKLKDRKKLDVEILKLLQLDETFYLPLIKTGLEEMVTERLFLPKQVLV